MTRAQKVTVSMQCVQKQVSIVVTREELSSLCAQCAKMCPGVHIVSAANKERFMRMFFFAVTAQTHLLR